MDIPLFWSIFIVLTISYFMIALGAARPNEPGEDFFFANRRLAFIPLALSLAATEIGAGLVLGSANEAYNYGIFGLAYSIGMALGLIILSLGIVQIWRKKNIKTGSQFLLIKYKSNFLAKTSSILSVIALLGILTSQIIASRYLLEITVGDYKFILIIFWLVVIFYTMFGGFRAVIATNIFQLLVIIIVLLLAFYLIEGQFKWPTGLDNWLGSNKLFSPKASMDDSRFARPEWSRLSALIFLPFCYAFIGQDLGMRFFSARGPKTAALSAIIAAFIILLIGLLIMFFGVEARLDIINNSLINQASPYVLLDYIKTNLDPFFYYLVICAVIAAICSTADSALCAIGSLVIEDFSLNKNSNLDPVINILLSRLTIFITGVIALVLAYRFDNILKILFFSYELYVAIIFVPMIFALLLAEPKLSSALWAMLGGFLAFMFFRVLPIAWPHEIITVLAAFLAYILAELAVRIFARVRS